MAVVHVLVHVVLDLKTLSLQGPELRASRHLLVTLVLEVHVLGAVEGMWGGGRSVVLDEGGKVVKHRSRVAGALASTRARRPPPPPRVGTRPTLPR